MNPAITASPTVYPPTRMRLRPRKGWTPPCNLHCVSSRNTSRPCPGTPQRSSAGVIIAAVPSPGQTAGMGGTSREKCASHSNGTPRERRVSSARRLRGKCSGSQTMARPAPLEIRHLRNRSHLRRRRASWCGRCRIESSLCHARLSRRRTSGRYTFIGVNAGAERPTVARGMRSLSLGAVIRFG